MTSYASWKMGDQNVLTVAHGDLQYVSDWDGLVHHLQLLAPLLVLAMSLFMARGSRMAHWCAGVLGGVCLSTIIFRYAARPGSAWYDWYSLRPFLYGYWLDYLVAAQFVTALFLLFEVLRDRRKGAEQITVPDLPA